MTEDEKTLTTAEYSAKSGLTAATVARMLRQGKLRGEKRGGKWAIFASELQSQKKLLPKASNKTGARSSSAGDTRPADGNTYDVESFARLTFLTENGVRQWLRIGRLSGGTDSDGNLRVDASNLQRPDFQHLVR